MPSTPHDLVTVIVPTYNGSQHLAATLESLGAQDYAELEVIIVDDGSTDDSLDIARRSGVARTVLAQENFGVAVARNRGLAHARGRWVAFLDQDDLWRHDRVRNLVDYARTAGVAAVASTETPFAVTSDRPALEAVGDGRERWPQLWINPGQESTLIHAAPDPFVAESTEVITVQRLMMGAAMLTTSVLYEREIAIAAGGCAPHARALDDHMLNLNVARMTGGIHRIDTRDLLYRVHPASATTTSPMAGPLLSALASIRLGGVFPTHSQIGPNVEHLLLGLSETELSPAEQMALVVLTVPRGSRAAWLARWGKRMLRRTAPGRRT